MVRRELSAGVKAVRGMADLTRIDLQTVFLGRTAETAVRTPKYAVQVNLSHSNYRHS